MVNDGDDGGSFPCPLLMPSVHVILEPNLHLLSTGPEFWNEAKVLKTYATPYSGVDAGKS